MCCISSVVFSAGAIKDTVVASSDDEDSSRRRARPACAATRKLLSRGYAVELVETDGKDCHHDTTISCDSSEAF